MKEEWYAMNRVLYCCVKHAQVGDHTPVKQKGIFPVRLAKPEGEKPDMWHDAPQKSSVVSERIHGSTRAANELSSQQVFLGLALRLRDSPRMWL